MSFKHHYYIPGGYDANQGGGYGTLKGKLPSTGTGLGSDRALTGAHGIYAEPPKYHFDDEEQEEFFDEIFGDLDDLDAFVTKVNQIYRRSDPSRRADRATFVRNQRLDLAPMAEKRLPRVSDTISPFSNRVLYPNGFDGPPLGTGNANQAFRTTGPYKRTGTQYGTSRSPLSLGQPEDTMPALSLYDILDDDERAILRQRVKIMRLLADLDFDEASSDEYDAISEDAE